MFSKLLAWFENKLAYFLVIGTLITVGYIAFNSLTNPPDLKEFKGSIQNHLLWSNKGECFFVRPYSVNAVYLIRVEDCDKGK